MEAPGTLSSWMVRLHKGINETTVLGDLRCEDQTRVGEAVILLVTCNEEEITRIKKQKDVEYVELNVETSLRPCDFEQGIHQETIQPLEAIRDFPKARHATKCEKSTSHSEGQRVIGHLQWVNECDFRRTGDDIWALSRIAQRDKPSDLSQSEYHISTTSTGENVNVYILDSGIKVDHSEFRVGITRRTDVTAIVGDTFGHGTAVASLVIGKSVGVASKANVIDVKLTENRVVHLFDLIKGLRFVIEDSKGKNNCVANISIAFKKGVLRGPTLNDQIACCYNAGITMVVAAGNDGASASDYSPANLPQCITVASSNKNDQLAAHSNHGECVDVVAPGEKVKIAGIKRRPLISKSGTSFAAPIVTGVIARYLSEVETPRTPQEVATWLKEHCTPNKLAPCTKNTPNLLVHAPCSMTGMPCPRGQPQPGPVLPPVPGAAE